MKVTSFEISKKLAEIGFFKPEEATGSYCDVEQRESGIGFVPTKEHRYLHYGLETILDALPHTIEAKNFFGENRFFSLHMVPCRVWEYRTLDGDQSQFANSGKSSVDAAARLLIRLHEEGLVKFERLTKNSE